MFNSFENLPGLCFILYRYTPIADLDYGTLSCSAMNDIGYQAIPCMFQMVAAGKLPNVLFQFLKLIDTIYFQIFIYLKLIKLPIQLYLTHILCFIHV